MVEPPGTRAMSEGRPNRAQIASDPAQSVWVDASAGSGKTRVLSERVLRLLLAGTPPNRILCLTFTKVAAAEMAARVSDSLAGWSRAAASDLERQLTELTGAAPNPTELRQARRLFATVLEAPGGLRIETIHGFAESLLKRFPLEAAVAPHFEVLDERTAALLLAGAQARVLRGPDDEIRTLLAEVALHADETRFDDLMRQLTGNPLRLAALAERQGARALAALARQLGLPDRVPEDAGFQAEAVAEGAFDRPALARVAAALLQGGAKDQGTGEAIARWLAATDRVSGFAAYCRAFLTTKSEIRKKLIHKEALRLAPDGNEIMSAEANRLHAVAAQRRAAELHRASAALLRLGLKVAEVYRQEKHRRAALDYDDLILTASALLRRPGIAPWVLYKLDGGLEHVLIDEAQDTNAEQWRIVQALTQEFFAGQGASAARRTLFAVGDPKQSIFSFQGADPRAFHRLRAEFARDIVAAGLPWQEVPLATSYRSAPPILQFVDAVFSEPAAFEALGEGAPLRHHAHRRGAPGLIELWSPESPAAKDAAAAWQPPLSQEGDDNPVERLAARLTRQIGYWLRSGEVLPSTGRPIGPGDILVLLRQRQPFLDALVRRMKQADLPIAGADRMCIGEQLAVMDLLALARFALLPEDDLSLAAVLKSPLVGLDDALLFELAHGRPGSLWQALLRRRGARPEFARAAERLSRWLGRADQAPPYGFFAELLIADGGRHDLVARLGPDANDPLDELLSLALHYQRHWAPSLQGFLAWLAGSDPEVKRDQEQRAQEVRVMTVHGAKGLQAPIVVLPDTCRVPVLRQTVFWLDGAMLWSPRAEPSVPAAVAAREAQGTAAARELQRLLYVALTRAQDRLLIAGWQGRSEPAADSWHSLAVATIQRLGRRATAFDGGPAWRFGDEPKAGASPGPAPPAALAAAPDFLRRPAPPEPEPTDAAGGDRYRRGRVLHRLVQVLPDLPPPQRAAAAGRLLAAEAAFSAAERQRLADEALAVLADPAFSPLFGPGSLAEVPLAGLVNGRTILGQVDRLAVGAEQVQVVDFKSDRAAPRDAGGVPVAHLRQMAAYVALLTRMYPGRTVSAALLYTEAPRLIALPATLLAAHSP
ncbi:MAG: double-strand break repair helicase AddA [Alphaproteobacteria bacterium]|nr:double-strand break repair helicase AddA [Alphaproteobacteria bacterium]